MYLHLGHQRSNPSYPYLESSFSVTWLTPICWQEHQESNINNAFWTLPTTIFIQPIRNWPNSANLLFHLKRPQVSWLPVLKPVYRPTTTFLHTPTAQGYHNIKPVLTVTEYSVTTINELGSHWSYCYSVSSPDEGLVLLSVCMCLSTGCWVLPGAEGRADQEILELTTVGSTHGQGSSHTHHNTTITNIFNHQQPWTNFRTFLPHFLN